MNGLPNYLENFDAQAALSFVVSQTTSVETTVYREPLPDITYPDIIPIDYSANPWATSVTYYSVQGYGQAQWFNGAAYDIPNADTKRSQFQAPVYMAAVGYEYNIEEVAQAQWLGIPLTSDKAMAARRAYEEFCERVAFVGDAPKGFSGIVNYPGVTVTPVTGGTWAAAVAADTPQVIFAQLNTALGAIFTGTNTVGYADTILLPPDQYMLLASTPMNALSQMTLLQWFIANNATTAATQRPITIRMMRQLDGAGVGATDRMVVYRRAPDVLKMHIPMAHRFFAPQQIELTWKVPGIFRLGGVDVRRPKEIGYWDGI